MYSLDLTGLHPLLKPYAEYAIKLARYNGITPTVTSVSRSWAEQAKLYANYLWCLEQNSVGRKVGGHDCRYPANAPGDSAHQPRRVASQAGALAWDSSVPPEQMETWIAIRRYCGFHVPNNDHVHAELPDWRKYIAPGVGSPDDSSTVNSRS